MEDFNNIPKQIETPEEVVKRYLQLLELKKEDLIDKSILDVGSGGDAKFARGMREEGISENVTSFDRHGSNVEKDKSFVIGDTQDMPFGDNSFDYVLSVSALPGTAHMRLIRLKGSKDNIRTEDPVPTIVENLAEYEQKVTELTALAVRECLRVVKDGGEIRFASRLNNPQKLSVIEGVKDGILGIGEIIKSSEDGDKKIYIIRKVSS